MNWRQKLLKFVGKIVSEIKRIGFESTLLIFILGGSFFGLLSLGRNLDVVAYKVLVLCVAVIFAHISRQLLFPYIDLERFIFPDPDHNQPDRVRAAVIVGVLLFMSALILGFTLGL